MSGYELRDYFNEKGEMVIAVEITDGEYKNTVFSFSEVKFLEPPLYNFKYVIYERVGNTNCDKFKSLLSNILQDFIDESFQNNSTVFAGGI